MLNERVWSVGLNAEDREFRSRTSRFNDYVVRCRDNEKKKYFYNRKSGSKTSHVGGSNSDEGSVDEDNE